MKLGKVDTYIFLALMVLLTMALCSCWGRSPLSVADIEAARKASSGVGGTDTILGRIAAWGAGIAGLAFIAACVGAAWCALNENPAIGKCLKLAGLALVAVAACFSLGWVASHPYLVAAVGIAGGLVGVGLYVWGHKHEIAHKLGIAAKEANMEAIDMRPKQPNA